MKKVIVPAMLGFGVVMALIIGQRMSTDAMAVVLGVAVGVAASVPTSVLLLALLRRAQREASWRPESSQPVPQQPMLPAAMQPNIIVLNPADLMGQRNGQAFIPPPSLELTQDGGLRRLRVVGDDDDWTQR
jgi:hypothetical protein